MTRWAPACHWSPAPAAPPARSRPLGLCYSARVSDGPPRAEVHAPGGFDAAYAGTPPWDIGRPQPVFVALADAGALRGRILDVGCGTGEHVLMAVERGLDATGVDAAPAAIARARRKAEERGLDARFLRWDALELADLEERFDTVLDSGLFHVFDDEDRGRYVRSLAAVLRPGGRYLGCCFSDREPGAWGPRRVTEAELRAAFADGWRIEAIEPARFEVLMEQGTVEAWLTMAVRR